MKTCSIEKWMLFAAFVAAVLSACPATARAQHQNDARPQDEPERPKVDQQRVAELTKAILDNPFEPKNYRLRALQYARVEAWDRAAADFRKVVELNPVKSQTWQQAAALIVLSEDADAYERHAAKMLERFGASDNQGDLERTPKVCCLAPRPVGELAKLQKLAEAAVEASGDSYFSAYHPRTLALVYYRRKQYAQALVAIEKSDRLNLEFDERKFGDIEVSNRAIEAMCLVRRGKLKEAEAMLAKAAPILADRFDDPDELYEDEFWHDWLIAKILHDEAQRLVKGGGMGDVPWGIPPARDRIRRLRDN